MTFGGTLSEKPRKATTQCHRPSVCKVARLGVSFVFSVIFAGCKLIGVCSPLKCDFSEFFTASQKVVVVVREIAALVAAVD
jgi:hypothetical protein